MKELIAFVLAFTFATVPLTGRAHAQAPFPSTSAAGQVLIDAGSLIGSRVRTPEGQDIGKVSALMIDPKDGHIASAVIMVGGIFGIGGNTVGVPWSALRVGRDNQRLIVTMDQNALEQAPSASPPTSAAGQPSTK